MRITVTSICVGLSFEYVFKRLGCPSETFFILLGVKKSSIEDITKMNYIL